MIPESLSDSFLVIALSFPVTSEWSGIICWLIGLYLLYLPNLDSFAVHKDPGNRHAKQIEDVCNYSVQFVYVHSEVKKILDGGYPSLFCLDFHSNAL